MRTLAAALFACLFMGSGLLGCTGTIGGPSGAGDDDGTDAGAVTSSTDAAPNDPDAAPAELPLAGAIHISDVSVYQAVEVEILVDRTPVADAARGTHVIDGQTAMIGVFVTVDAAWQTRQVVGELDIEVAPGDVRRFTTTQTISGNSGPNPIASGLAFTVDGTAVAVGARYSVAIKELTGQASYPGTTEDARYPAAAGALQDMEVRDSGPLNLVLVPFEYNADGSGRLPPLDDVALGYYRDLFGSMYPTGQVNLTVRAAVPYSSSIGSGSGWNGWLDTLTSIRDNDNPVPNTYYYGVAAPRSSFNSFCNGGCIIGLGWVPGQNDEYGRAAVGVSFPDRVGSYTAAHEVGHTMGRNHAPCGGPSGVDGNFPYSGAHIGVWGFDASKDTLKDPDDFTDVMGYCDDQWISDYTHDGIFHRLSYVNQLTAASATPVRYRVGIVDADGAVDWRRYDDVSSRVAGEPIAISMADGNGNDRGSVDGHFYRYDHLEGGMLLVPVVDGPEPVTIHADEFGALAW